MVTGLWKFWITRRGLSALDKENQSFGYLYICEIQLYWWVENRAAASNKLNNL